MGPRVMFLSMDTMTIRVVVGSIWLAVGAFVYFGARGAARAGLLAVVLLSVGCGMREPQEPMAMPTSIPALHEGWAAFRAAGQTFEVETVPSVWGLTDNIALASATCANEGARLPTSAEWRVMEELDFFGLSVPRDGIDRELFQDVVGAGGWYSVEDGVRYSQLSGWYLLRCARTVYEP